MFLLDETVRHIGINMCSNLMKPWICKESLIHAVYKWETYDYMLPPNNTPAETYELIEGKTREDVDVVI